MNTSSTPCALVVDDNFYNRDLCTLVLQRTGYTVEQAENGEEALNLLRKQTFDLLVVDLAMPVMDGITMMREYQKEETSDDTYVVVMTANPHMAYHPDFQIDYIMYKPIEVLDFEKLAQRLKTRSNRATG